MSFTFTGLLSNNCNNMNLSDKWGASLLKSDDCVGIESPSSFKSLPPSSLPLSPSSIYHSYSDFPPGFSPTDELLNAPLFLSSSNSFNWRNTSSEDQQSNKEDEKNYSDPSFETQTEHVFLFESSSSMFQEDQLKEQDTLKFNEPSKQMNFSYEMTATEFEEPSTQNFFSDMALTKPEIQSNSALGSNYVNYTDSSKSNTEQKGSEDGYNWRKYGEKQMKGSKNPRSYYKCTHPNCLMKKKVEKTLDGHITEIVYKGTHKHPKPESARKMSAQSLLQHSSSGTNSGNSDQSVGEEDFEQTSPRSYNGRDEDEYGQKAKRWKGENENNGIAYSTSGSTTVKEPRVIVQTTSEIDILDDGYRWRKYGQKVVKGNPNPRSYYKCVTPGCSVRKHVERAAHDVKAVITTYEGKHNHELPIGRGSSSYSMSRTSLDNYISNITAPTPIKPSAVMTNFSSSPILTNLLHDTELPGPGIQEPFPLDKLLSPSGTFGYSASGRSIGSYANQGQHSGAAYSATDKEQNESFLKSFLSKNL